MGIKKVVRKKGIFFTVDAILAILLTMLAVVLVSSYYYFHPLPHKMDYTSYDVLQVLGEMKISESQNPYVKSLINNGTITRLNNSILEQVGEFWADNDTIHAQDLTFNVMKDIYGNDTNWALSVGGDLIYETSSTVSDNVRNSQRMVSGLEKLKPTYGFTARATLTRIKSRVIYGYGYFGGFVGQGNISIPMKLTGNITKISEIYLELSAASNFSLFINGNYSGVYKVGQGGGNPKLLKPDMYVLNARNNSFIKNGTNTIQLRFYDTNFDKEYVSGGLLRIKYTTSSNQELETDFVGPNTARQRYDFPGISGAINLFDSFYVPGLIKNMTIHLKYFTNHSRHNNTIIFSVAGYPLIVDNESTTNQNIIINNTILSTIFGTYDSFNDTTVPLRFGFANITRGTGIVDVGLVMDKSGSMILAGWNLINHTQPQGRINNVNVPRSAWSAVYTFNVTTTGSISDGIMFETENFNQRINRSSHYWNQQTTWGGYSGSSYMQALPNNGASYSNNVPTTSPELRYQVNFPSAGTYYIWVRCRVANGNDDTMHAGLDGVLQGTSDKIIMNTQGSWGWTQSTSDGPVATISVATAGVHTFSIWMREDGFAADKIILTKSSSFVPSGTGQLPSVQKGLALSHEWKRVIGFNGSEGSEMMINVRRPDGNWIIGGGTTLPANPSITGVDPPTVDIGSPLEYFSGRSTKPQVIEIEQPQTGQWAVAVYGMNFRPTSGPPNNINTNISIFVDRYDLSTDGINRTPTIISFDAARSAATHFVNMSAASDQLSLISFESSATVNQVLTTNKNAVRTAISGLAASGGTRIDLGITSARGELTSVRKRANATQIMILLTDGQNDLNPSTVITAATAAKAAGIRIFTIGLGSFTDIDLLKSVATNPSDAYYAPTGAQLDAIYEEISRVITAEYRSQVLFLKGGFKDSKLYPDSYIEFYYTPKVDPLQFGQIPLSATSPAFWQGGDLINFSGDTILTDLKVASYSAENWTAIVDVDVNGAKSNAFNIENFGTNYSFMGDPFLVHIPLDSYSRGMPNKFIVLLGTGAYVNKTNGSKYNRLLYSVRINGILDFGSVVGRNTGCHWYIPYEDDTQDEFFLPTDYTGNKTCYYANRTYDPEDARDLAAFALFSKLDFNKNGKLEAKPEENNLILEILEVSSVPSLWGPSLFEVKSWR
jgi:hypothetical protein